MKLSCSTTTVLFGIQAYMVVFPGIWSSGIIVDNWPRCPEMEYLVVGEKFGLIWNPLF